MELEPRFWSPSELANIYNQSIHNPLLMVFCLVRTGVRASSVSQLRMHVGLFNSCCWQMNQFQERMSFMGCFQHGEPAAKLEQNRSCPWLWNMVTSPSQNLHFQHVSISIIYFKCDAMKYLFGSLFLPGLCSHKVLCSPGMTWSHLFHLQ